MKTFSFCGSGVSLVVLLLALMPTTRAASSPSLKTYNEFFGCYDPGGKTIRTSAKIKGTRVYAEHEEHAIYQDVRVDTDGYTLKVPNGSYHVQLKFCEIQHGRVGQRIFAVKVQGERVIDRLDIFARAGKNKAYELISPEVKVTDGLLRIQFVRIVGAPCIAAMSVGGTIAGAPTPIQGTFYQHINCGGPAFRGYYADFGN